MLMLIGMYEAQNYKCMKLTKCKVRNKISKVNMLKNNICVEITAKMEVAYRNQCRLCGTVECFNILVVP